MKRIILLGLVALLTSGCAMELVFSGISAGVGLIGVGQRVISHRIDKEKNEQLKQMNERIRRLCEEMKKRGTPTEEPC